MNVIERQTAARSKPKIIGKSLAISEAIPSPEIFEARTVFHDVEPPRSKAELRVSEEEYWAKYYSHPDFSYEWNNGILEEKPMADYRSSKMYRWFFLLLNEYLKAYSIAKLVCLDIGFRLALPDKTSIRKPDLAVILDANPINIADDDCTYKGIFDLCIEFLSDSTPKESRRDTVVKKGEYCQAGVSEYFILDRKGLQTAFYRLTDRGVYAPLPQPGGIVRSEVLAGLQFRAADLYAQPDFRDRLADGVYASYLLQDYQIERQKTETAEHRAEAAERRAEAERQEKLKLLAKLRELGLDPAPLTL